MITAYWNPDHLLDAYESLTRQEIRWRWLVQCGRPLPENLTEILREDGRVLVQNNPRRIGQAMSRNRALLRCDAPMVLCLDDDDLLPDGALRELAGALEQAPPEVFGAWGETLTLLPNGQTTSFKSWQASGLLAPGSISGPYLADGRLRIHCGSLLWRREHLVASGGWMGLLRCEDTNLVLCADARRPSWYVDRPAYLYRVHDRQTVKTSEWRADRESHHAFNRERLAALSRIEQLRSCAC